MEYGGIVFCAMMVSYNGPSLDAVFEEVTDHNRLAVSDKTLSNSNRMYFLFIFKYVNLSRLKFYE